ncbi:MAG TPA: hypothetical protein VFF73_14485 [Planctomycetota bacterium]|nr:hypothetical protein [Planctomycetota bacterium]
MTDSENRELERRAVVDPLARRQLLERQRRLGLLELAPSIAKNVEALRQDAARLAWRPLPGSGERVPGLAFTCTNGVHSTVFGTWVDFVSNATQSRSRFLIARIDGPIFRPSRGAVQAGWSPRPYSPPYIDGLPPDPR